MLQVIIIRIFISDCRVKIFFYGDMRDKNALYLNKNQGILNWQAQAFQGEAISLRLNLLFVHEPVTDYFLNQGIIPKLVDFNEGACWLESEDITRFGFKKGLTKPEDQFANSPRKKDGHGAVAARKSKIGLMFIDAVQKQYRNIMEKSGLLFDEHLPFSDLADAVAVYYQRDRRFGTLSSLAPAGDGLRRTGSTQIY